MPVIPEPEERVIETIEELRARHTPVIVDTAGFRNRTTISALVAAETWVHVVRGEVAVNGVALQAGDAAAIDGEANFALTGQSAGSSEVLLFDLG